MESERIQKQLIIFDFDWYNLIVIRKWIISTDGYVRSFVDQDTDRWVAEVLDTKVRRKMEDLEPHMQWTDIV